MMILTVRNTFGLTKNNVGMPVHRSGKQVGEIIEVNEETGIITYEMRDEEAVEHFSPIVEKMPSNINVLNRAQRRKMRKGNEK